jgi:hypothetical protein
MSRYVKDARAYAQSKVKVTSKVTLAALKGMVYEDVSKSFRTGRLERELQMVQLSATKCSCIAIL